MRIIEVQPIDPVVDCFCCGVDPARVRVAFSVDGAIIKICCCHDCMDIVSVRRWWDSTIEKREG